MADAFLKPATILQHCRVTPPLDSAATRLPLTFFDIGWIYFHPIQRLLFYQFACSNSYFLEKIVPDFKSSLSQTLKHYLPLAGNLVFPPNKGVPEIQFQPGDSIQLTIAESNQDSDFNYLTGNQPRVADEFYAFIPDLQKPEYEYETDTTKAPVFAIQITLFPNTGICIGLTNHHVVGDASSVVGFIKVWSKIASLGENNDADKIMTLSPPLYDRSLIKDPSDVLNHFWNQMKLSKLESLPLHFPTNKVRATFIMHKNHFQYLKNLVQSKNPSLTHLSFFTITVGYVWSCLAKSSEEAGEDVDEDEPEYLGFVVDARARLDPPVPSDYFGNCLALAIVETTHGELIGENGFELSVELIGGVISNKVNKKDEILRDAKEWIEKFGGMLGKRLFGIAGSPKFDLYDTNFGWGKPKKHEAVTIDGDGSMSLCKSREFEGGLEIGLSLPERRMEAFAQIFSKGLKM